MELLGERPVWSMSGSEMLSTLDALDAELARLQTYRLHVIAGVEDIGYAEEIGAHDTARLLMFRHRIDSAEAHRDVRLARSLPKYGAVSAALPNPDRESDPAAVLDSTPAPVPDPEPAAENLADADGVVGSEAAARRPLRPAQAQAIVWALDRVAARVTVDNLAVAEAQLVGLAAHLSPGQLRKAGKEIGDLLDSDGPEPDEHKAYARESLTLANGENGVKFRGFLANENAELLRSLIHSGARPHKTADGELDPRSREKRQADALTAALTIAAAVNDTGFTPPRRTTFTDTDASRAGATGTVPTDNPVIAPPATAAAGARPTDAGLIDPATVAAGTAGWVPGFGAKANITVTIDFHDLKAATADATGQLVYGDALSAAAIRRLACDAKIIPLVLGSNSEPLDVGRSERLVNRAIRRALNARDRGCVVCGAPPIHCDAHHIRSWIDGGPTAITNLVLLCRRHHIDLHAGHWTITITNGTVHVARPTWADPPPPITRRSAPQPGCADSSVGAAGPNTGAAGPNTGAARPNTGAARPNTGAARRPDSDGVPDSGEAAHLECWGEEASALTRTPSSINRWPDDATRQEAVRFAVWGDTSAGSTAADSTIEGDAGPDRRILDRGAESRSPATWPPPGTASTQPTRTTNPVNVQAAVTSPVDVPVAVAN